MRVSIFGLGYVGAVAGACIADSGHDVIAVDIDPAKIKCVNEGRSPIVEPGLAEIIERNVKAGRLRGVLSCAQAIADSEISLICVGTPGDEIGALKLDHIEAVCRDIGLALKNKNLFHSVVLRSTLVPGMARNVVIPLLEKFSGKKAGRDFGFANNPEFLREGSAVHDYFHPPKIVIGTLDERTAKAVSALYKNIDAAEVFTQLEVAEGVKYAGNIWHAMKVGFANEFGNIMKEHGVDSHKVMEIFFLDQKLNMSEAYLMPGFAFGGSCLPKDLRALRASAKEKGLKTPLFDSLLMANDEQVQRAREMVKRSGRNKVGMLGLSFKAGTDDLRESPLVALADFLINDGIELRIYDPSVLKAANIHERLARYLVETPDELLEKSDIFIVGNHGDDFRNILEKANDNKPVIDLVRLKDGEMLEKRKSYSGICW